VSSDRRLAFRAPRRGAVPASRDAAPERSLHPTKHVLRVRAFRWRWWLTDPGASDTLTGGYASTRSRAESRADKEANRIHRERTEAQR
jgi:hypothetical protein